MATERFKQEIEDLKSDIEDLKTEREELKTAIKELEKKNLDLIAKYDSIYNITIKSKEFKEEFKEFQKHFSNINKYTSLKAALVKQIKKDSIFIKDSEKF